MGGRGERWRLCYEGKPIFIHETPIDYKQSPRVMLHPPYDFLTYTNIPPPLLYVTTKPKPNHDPIHLNLHRTNIYPTTLHYPTLHHLLIHYNPSPSTSPHPPHPKPKNKTTLIITKIPSSSFSSAMYIHLNTNTNPNPLIHTYIHPSTNVKNMGTLVPYRTSNKTRKEMGRPSSVTR